MCGRKFLLDIDNRINSGYNKQLLSVLGELGLLCCHRCTLGAPLGKSHRKQCNRMRKRGKRGDVQARLAANPHKPAIPTLLLSNVRSLNNKLDYIKLWRASHCNVIDCCATVFTETWLNQDVTDAAVQVEGLMLHRADRSAAPTGKQRGGCSTVYINRLWCQSQCVVLSQFPPAALKM